MKKFCLLLAMCLMLTGLFGCGGSTEETQASSGAATEATDPADTISSESTEPPTTEPPIVEVTGYDIALPEGFEVSVAEAQRTVYESPNAPMDTSTVVVETSARDLGVLELDDESFMAMYPDVEEFRRITALEVTEVDGIPALFVDYTTKEGSVYTHIYEYHVVAAENYMFRFSDSTTGNDWLDLYAESAATINMLTMKEGIQMDYSDLEKYDLDCGISLYAVPGMEKQDAPGFTACIGSRKAIILVMEDNKRERGLKKVSLEEYADLVSQANDLEKFTLDNYGNLHVDFYSTDADGVEYFNNLTVKEIGDSFWVFQMTCAADDQASYAREFPVWATSIG